jgi:hypothetical protein
MRRLVKLYEIQYEGSTENMWYRIVVVGPNGYKLEILTPTMQEAYDKLKQEGFRMPVDVMSDLFQGHL